MISQTNNNIKSQISSFAEFLAERFYEKNKTNLQAICEDENILLIVAGYQNYFDGMLVWDGEAFGIHLNTDRGNTPDSKRGRFTLSHELGHYFLDSHREGIKGGIIPFHASCSSLVHSDRMETEADYFAANLLMPRNRLRNFTGKRKFSLDVIKEISEAFDVSLTSACLRFAEVGTHEIMIVFSQDNLVKWSCRSLDFPKLANKFKIGGTVPPTSVAGESFLHSDAQYTGVELIDLEDWFEYRGWEPGRQLFEQCFYSDLYGYVISLIWFK